MGNICHMFYTSASLFMPSFFSTAAVLLIYEHGDWMLRLMTSDERSIPLRSIPWNATRLPSTFHQSLSSAWVIQGLEDWTNDGPWVTGDPRKCRGKVIFVKSRVSISLFLSFIHSLILPLPRPPVPHPHSFSSLTPPFALAQVLNYFQTARQGTAGAQGTIWT